MFFVLIFLAVCKHEVCFGFIDVRLTESPPNIRVCLCVYVRVIVTYPLLAKKSFKDFNWMPPADAKYIPPESQNPFNVSCILLKGAGSQRIKTTSALQFDGRC